MPLSEQALAKCLDRSAASRDGYMYVARSLRGMEKAPSAESESFEKRSITKEAGSGQSNVEVLTVALQMICRGFIGDRFSSRFERLPQFSDFEKRNWDMVTHSSGIRNEIR